MRVIVNGRWEVASAAYTRHTTCDPGYIECELRLLGVGSHYDTFYYTGASLTHHGEGRCQMEAYNNAMMEALRATS